MAFICCFAFVLMTGMVHAASLSPSVMELEGVRGEVVSQTFKIINTEAVPQTYYLGVVKFVPSDDGSTPTFIPYDQDHSGMPEWIQLPAATVVAPARSSVDVPFSVAIPQDASSGSVYAAITVSEAPSDVVASNGAIIEAKTAMLLLLTVQGETRTQWAVLDVTSKLFNSIRTSINGEIVYRVQNQGNVHMQPKGTVRFVDLFGRTVFQVDANKNGGRVLPGTTRTFTVEISPNRQPFAMGPINVFIDFEDDDGLQDVQMFFLVPVIPLLIAGFLVVFSLFLMRRFRRT